MAHTEGEWELWGALVVSPRNGYICSLTEKNVSKELSLSSNHWDEAMDNGKLIAAAPALLAVLQRCAEILNEAIEYVPGGGLRVETINACDMARAAIAKATDDTSSAG